MDEIASRLIAVRDEHGGEAIWPYSGTGNVGFIQGSGLPAGARLWNALGASHHSGTICSISGHVGLGYSTGIATGMDPEDIALAGTVLLWGTNTLVANQHLWPFVEKARDSGGTVVVIDPVRTRTAQRADIHIALRPGTDGALALGLCRELIARGSVDHEFLELRSEGFDDFRRMVEQWTLEATASECGLEEHEVSVSLMSSRPLPRWR